jgi:hypothetical protein
MSDEIIVEVEEEVVEEKKAPKKKAKKAPKKSGEKFLYKKVGSSVSVWRTEEAIKNSGEDWEKVED